MQELEVLLHRTQDPRAATTDKLKAKTDKLVSMTSERDGHAKHAASC